MSVIDQKCFRTAFARRYQICVHTHDDFSMDEDKKLLVSSSAWSCTNVDFSSGLKRLLSTRYHWNKHIFLALFQLYMSSPRFLITTRSNGQIMVCRLPTHLYETIFHDEIASWKSNARVVNDDGNTERTDKVYLYIWWLCQKNNKMHIHGRTKPVRYDEHTSYSTFYTSTDVSN